MGRRPVPSLLEALVLDVDGVMTDGSFWYTADGKVAKRFGPDDSDALAHLVGALDIHFVSADHRGFAISQKRITEDMGFPLELVSSCDRLDWIADRWPLENVAYMGDGILDPPILRAVGFGIAPADGDSTARAAADLVTERSGGNRAVAEACMYLFDRLAENRSPHVRDEHWERRGKVSG